VCGMEDAEVVHCTNCECALVATLRARIAELEEGNVRRQVALEARIAELEREVVRVDGERCDLEADLQDETGLSCEDGLRDMVFVCNKCGWIEVKPL